MDIRTFHNVWSPELRNRRTIDVYLPASYSRSRRRYPVVYMQDGQNLSDPALAFSGIWELPSALAELAADGIEPIVVGIHNAGKHRLAEYSPFADSRHGGGYGIEYLRFVARTLKPRIDRRFRTLAHRDLTILAGSSMGGLISLYGFFRYRSVFGGAAALSPALWFGDGRVFRFIERAIPPKGRIYLDVGTAEGEKTVRDAHRMRGLLLAQGYGPGSLLYLEAVGATHSETAWAARLPTALRFLLRASR